MGTIRIDPAHLESVYDPGVQVVCILDEVAHAAIVAICERLLWSATWEQDLSGLPIGERAHDQLLDTMPLSDLIDLLNCICENTGDVAAGVGPGATIEEIKQDNEGRTIRRGKKDFPKPGDAEIPYGAVTWEDALNVRCQQAQYLATAGLEGFQWINDNMQAYRDFFVDGWAFKLLRELIDRLIGPVAVPLGAFWQVWMGTIDLLSSLNFLQQWADNYNDIVCVLYLADDPKTAAENLIAGPLNLWPFGSYILSWLLESVYTGEVYPTIGGDPEQRDVSEYNSAFCDSCGEIVGEQTIWLTFANDAEAWTSAGRSANWAVSDDPNAPTYTLRTEPATFTQTLPYTWIATSWNNNIVGTFGTTTLIVPQGVDAVVAKIWGTAWTNDNYPQLTVSGSISGGAGGPTVVKAVTPGETLSVTLYNVDFGSAQSQPIIPAIELFFYVS